MITERSNKRVLKKRGNQMTSNLNYFDTCVNMYCSMVIHSSGYFHLCSGHAYHAVKKIDLSFIAIGVGFCSIAPDEFR